MCGKNFTMHRQASQRCMPFQHLMTQRIGGEITKQRKNIQCEINLQKRAQGKKTRTPNVMSENWSTCLQRGRRGPVLTKCRTSHHCYEHGRTYTILTQTVAGEINFIPFIFSMCQLLLTSHLYVKIQSICLTTLQHNMTMECHSGY